MGFLNDMISRAKSFFEDLLPEPDARNAVQRNSFDRRDWEDVQRQSPVVRDEVERMSEKIDYAADLMADLHAGFFKADPRLTPPDEMAESHKVNHQVMDRLLQTPEVSNLRQHTAGDKFASAMAMQAVQSKVVEAVQEVHSARSEAQKKLDEQRKKSQEAQDALQEALGAAEAAQQGGSPIEQGMAQQALQQAMDQFDQQQQQQQSAQEDLNQAEQQAVDSQMNKMRQAAREVTDELDEQDAMMSAFGVDPGEIQKMSVKERLELAKKLKDNRLSEFIKLIGQFKAVQQAESRKRVINAASEVHGVTYSDRLERMTPGEYLNFADPSLETLMLLRFVNHQLETYDVRGKEKLGQGPIICVVDESGSMNARDVAGGTREAWSKALSLAMLEQARHRKRDFVYIGFSSAMQQHTVEFPGGASDLTKVITMTEHFFGGGTHYEKPLMTALEYIEKQYDERQAERPDIVFITDDEYCQLPEAFLEEYRRVKDKTSIKTYGIALGCSTSGALEQVSDNVRSVTELVSDPRKVGDLFRTI